jgi:hypothetical protein
MADRDFRSTMGTPRRFVVSRGDEVVLEISDQPGPLISKKAPPPAPGESPVQHSFLSGIAHVPKEEGTLREALSRSNNLAEYLDSLRELGFNVAEEKTQP